MKRIFGIAAALAATVWAAGPASATEAVTLTTPGTEYGGGLYTLGFEFTVVGNQTITALGVYDSGQDGLDSGADIGLWDADGNLLATVTLPDGTCGTLIGDFCYGNIAPFTAIAGTDYIVGAYTQDPASSLNTDQGGTGSIDPQVSIIEDRFSDFNSAFSFPDTSNGYPSGAWLGANFEFNGAVPEPITLSLFGAGLLGLGALRRRKARKAA